MKQLRPLFALMALLWAAPLVAAQEAPDLLTRWAEEPRAADSGNPIIAQRADITDRKGRILATNLDTYALYAQPPQMIDPARSAAELVRIFPELDEQELLEDFAGPRKFLWIRKQISPEQRQAVHDIGDPGLLFGPREMRIYPNGPIASHILGGASYGREGVSSAEVIGVAGVERQFDGYLRDPANAGKPLQLSLDLTVQAAAERVLVATGEAVTISTGVLQRVLEVHVRDQLTALADLKVSLE